MHFNSPGQVGTLVLAARALTASRPRTAGRVLGLTLVLLERLLPLLADRIVVALGQLLAGVIGRAAARVDDRHVGAAAQRGHACRALAGEEAGAGGQAGWQARQELHRSAHLWPLHSGVLATTASFTLLKPSPRHLT